MSEEKKSVHEKTVEKVLEPLKKTYGIEYFSYCQYHGSECKIFCSDTTAYSGFLADKNSFMPADVSPKNSVLDWNMYCSAEYLNYIRKRYHNPAGLITFVLRHDETYAEHVAISASANSAELMSKLQSSPQIRNDIIAHIRNQIHFNKKQIKPIIFYREISKDESTNTNQGNDVLPTPAREYVYGLNGSTYLTPAEKKCLILLLKMKTSKQISHQLGIKERTVETHIANIKRKLGAYTRDQLYKIACNNFIAPDLDE